MKNPTLMFNGESPEQFPPKVRSKTRMAVLTVSLQQCKIRHRKGIKNI